MRRTNTTLVYVEPSSIFIVYLAPTYRAAKKSAREKVTSTTQLDQTLSRELARLP